MFEPTGADAPQYTAENTANTLSKCRLPSPMAQKASTESSATNGNADRLDIVWAVENGSAGVLHAYDPADLAHEYYHSAQAANGRDTFTHNKFATPTIANGRVYVGTSVGVAVFGLLP